MDDPEDIFGKDIKDSSHLQIISSDEEDFSSQKSHDSLKAKAVFKTNSPTEKGNYYEEKFDRHLRLDKSVESHLSADTQNIIDEINKIFEKSETHEEPEETKPPKLLEKGKNIIKELTRKLASVPGELFTPRPEEPQSTPRRTRTRSARKTSHLFESYLEFMSKNSSPLDQPDDEEYKPGRERVTKRKTTKKKGRKGTPKAKRSKTATEEPEKHEEQNLGGSKSFDHFRYYIPTHLLEHPPPEDFLSPQDDSGEMICLKFAVVDQNRNVINDSRLDSVFIRTTETLGNIAKKIGELYKLGEEYYPRIKVIIDGETQDHDLQIGSPVLGVEERMQIDIKFPPKDENVMKNGYPPKSKAGNKSSHAHDPPEVVEID